MTIYINIELCILSQRSDKKSTIYNEKQWDRSKKEKKE